MTTKKKAAPEFAIKKFRKNDFTIDFHLFQLTVKGKFRKILQIYKNNRFGKGKYNFNLFQNQFTKLSFKKRFI